MPPSAQASTSKVKSKPAQGKDKVVKKPAVDSAVDIDSIFSKPTKVKSKDVGESSGKGKEKAKDDKLAKGSDEASGSTRLGGIGKKKKKVKKIDEGAINSTTTIAQPSNDRVVEVVDTSIPKVAAVVEPVKTTTKGKKRDKKDAEEDEMFADSRGTGPRRKTEEGFLIYKEVELDIDPEAGGTPLCPFDCECCF